jgi:LPS export ABC transporter protein LptC
MRPLPLSFKYTIQPFSIVTAFWAVTLFLGLACSNDPQEVKKITAQDAGPLEAQDGVRLTYTDSGIVKMYLEAPRAENYGQLENPTLEFPEGIIVRFFDADGMEESRITANYAIRYVNEKRWKARGNVIVSNIQNEKLNTEELFWDETTEKIYSNVFVKMTTDTQIIMGDGFEADQNFTNAVVKKVTGQIELQEDEL